MLYVKIHLSHIIEEEDGEGHTREIVEPVKVLEHVKNYTVPAKKYEQILPRVSKSLMKRINRVFRYIDAIFPKNNNRSENIVHDYAKNQSRTISKNIDGSVIPTARIGMNENVEKNPGNSDADEIGQNEKELSLKNDFKEIIEDIIKVVSKEYAGNKSTVDNTEIVGKKEYTKAPAVIGTSKGRKRDEISESKISDAEESDSDTRMIPRIFGGIGNILRNKWRTFVSAGQERNSENANVDSTKHYLAIAVPVPRENY